MFQRTLCVPEEYAISNPFSKSVHLSARLSAADGVARRSWHKIRRIITERRFLRYSVLALNLLLLAGVAIFVLQSPSSDGASNHTRTATDAPTDPLDQLSSADIALSSARMVGLAEEAGVKSQADSVNVELAVPPVYTTVIAKPQTVATELKSRRDIQTYTVLPGESVGSIATKFNVTSDSIKWSNGLSSDTVAAGSHLTIPPVNGIVYVVKAGDNPDNLASKYKASKEQIVAYNDAELGGLQVGEQIIIPNGQLPAPTRSSYGFSWGGGAVYGFNGYDFGFCTWYVANKRVAAGNPVPANLGNASTWDKRASLAGMNVNRTPGVGAAVVTSHKGAGHVAYVERVQDDGIWISEMNSHGQRSAEDASPAGGWNKVDWKFVPMGTAVTYNYIH